MDTVVTNVGIGLGNTIGPTPTAAWRGVGGGELTLALSYLHWHVMFVNISDLPCLGEAAGALAALEVGLCVSPAGVGRAPACNVTYTS